MNLNHGVHPEVSHEPRPRYTLQQPELLNNFVYPRLPDWSQNDARELNREFFRGDLVKVWESACFIVGVKDVQAPDQWQLDSATPIQFTTRGRGTSDIFSMNGRPDPISTYLEIARQGGPGTWQELTTYVGAMQEALRMGFGIWRWHYGSPNGYGTIGKDLRLHITSFADEVNPADAERYMGNRGYKTGRTQTSRLLQWCDAYTEEEPTATYILRTLLTAKPEVLAHYMHDPLYLSEPILLSLPPRPTLGTAALAPPTQPYIQLHTFHQSLSNPYRKITPRSKLR